MHLIMGYLAILIKMHFEHPYVGHMLSYDHGLWFYTYGCRAPVPVEPCWGAVAYHPTAQRSFEAVLKRICSRDLLESRYFEKYYFIKK